MCHHGDEAVLESWREELEEREGDLPADEEPSSLDEEPSSLDEEPSYLNEERDVDVDILEADDD